MLAAELQPSLAAELMPWSVPWEAEEQWPALAVEHWSALAPELWSQLAPEPWSLALSVLRPGGQLWHSLCPLACHPTHLAHHLLLQHLYLPGDLLQLLPLLLLLHLWLLGGQLRLLRPLLLSPAQSHLHLIMTRQVLMSGTRS